MNMEETDPAVELAQQMLQAMDDEEDRVSKRLNM